MILNVAEGGFLVLVAAIEVALIVDVLCEVEDGAVREIQRQVVKLFVLICNLASAFVHSYL